MNLPELGLLLPYGMHSVLFVMLAPTNKTIISICIETFMWTQVFISFSQIPRDGISWYILGYVCIYKYYMYYICVCLGF